MKLGSQCSRRQKSPSLCSMGRQKNQQDIPVYTSKQLTICFLNFFLHPSFSHFHGFNCLWAAGRGQLRLIYKQFGVDKQILNCKSEILQLWYICRHIPDKSPAACTNTDADCNHFIYHCGENAKRPVYGCVQTLRSYTVSRALPNSLSRTVRRSHRQEVLLARNKHLGSLELT